MHFLQVNNSGISTIVNANFQCIIFIGTQTFGGYFQICISLALLRCRISEEIINQSETGSDEKNLPVELLSIFFQKTYYSEHSLCALWILYVFEMKILSLIFIRITLFSVCNFQSTKIPVELNSLLANFFCYITWLLYQLITRDTGRLANEAITLNALKITNCFNWIWRSICF